MLLGSGAAVVFFILTPCCTKKMNYLYFCFQAYGIFVHLTIAHWTAINVGMMQIGDLVSYFDCNFHGRGLRWICENWQQGLKFETLSELGWPER